jgi:hypothetical protein
VDDEQKRILKMAEQAIEKLTDFRGRIGPDAIEELWKRVKQYEASGDIERATKLRKALSDLSDRS